MSQKKKTVRKTSSYFFLVLVSFTLLALPLVLLFYEKHWQTLSAPEKSVTAKKKPVKEYTTSKEPPKAVFEPRPRVAIIIDDLGWNYSTASSLLALDAPLSFSILPNLKFSRRIAEEANRLDRDILLHIPMEAHGHFKEIAAFVPLRAAMNKELIESTLNAYMNAVPFIKGVNNHMGSRFTESYRGMSTVLNILKEKELFFVDSLTTPKSVAYSLARKLGLQAGRRSVFLDNDNSTVEIRKRFIELQKIAIKFGSAIGIGHARKNTVLVMRDMVIELNSAGVEIVPVSRILH